MEKERGRDGKNMKISPDVFMLEITRGKFMYQDRACYSMVYAVREPDGITLIDTGFPGFAYGILEELRTLGQHRLPLKQILLTHADLDHMGNAAWLQEKTGCPAWISMKEKVYVTGERSRLPEKQQMCKDCGLQIPRLQFYPPNRRVGEFEILDTPGHSAGHVCILYHGILFGGDLFSIADGTLQGANPQWSEDMETARRSLESLKPYKFTMLCPAHGLPDRRRDYL